MLIGVPKEIKNHEYRIGLTPAGVKELVQHGHQVLVQRDGGAAIGFDDEQYRQAGAEIVDQAAEIFARAEMIIKVKEPQPHECAMLRPGQLLFTYLHLAPDPRSGTEMTLLRMLAFQPAAAPGEGSTAVTSSARRATRTPVATKAARPAAAPQKQTAAWQEPDWAELAPRLGLSGLNGQLASNCAFLKREGDTIYFTLDSRAESYLTRARQDALANALSDHFGESLKVDVAIGEAEQETPVQVEQRKEQEQISAARAGLEADPNVKALKDMFGAELVEDSVEPISDK